jgi:hypothetical protein
LDRRLDGPQSQFGHSGGEEKNSQPLLGLEHPIIQPAAQSNITFNTKEKLHTKFVCMIYLPTKFYVPSCIASLAIDQIERPNIYISHGCHVILFSKEIKNPTPLPPPTGFYSPYRTLAFLNGLLDPIKKITLTKVTYFKDLLPHTILGHYIKL